MLACLPGERKRRGRCSWRLPYLHAACLRSCLALRTKLQLLVPLVNEGAGKGAQWALAEKCRNAETRQRQLLPAAARRQPATSWRPHAMRCRAPCKPASIATAIFALEILPRR